jgi:exosome complex exonuclease DIS3/RRP44
LQTVLEELRNRSLPIYHRLRNLQQDGKGIYFFHNEFRMETFVVRKVGESINDRNDRGIPFLRD